MPWTKTFFLLPLVLYGAFPTSSSDSAIERVGDFVDWALGREMVEIEPEPWEEEAFYDSHWDELGSIHHRFSEFNSERPETMAIEEWTRVYVVTQKPGSTAETR